VYEMFTGKRAFGGSSQASLIGAIMHAEPPPMRTGQPLTPPALERLVRTCLAKDPDRRWQSAADLARELRSVNESVPTATSAQQQMRWSARAVTFAALAAVAVAGLAGLIGFWLRPAMATPVVRFSIPPPSDGEFVSNPGGPA